MAKIREQLTRLTYDVDALTNAAPYHIGSRISYVRDRIQQTVAEIDECTRYPDPELDAEQ